MPVDVVTLGCRLNAAESDAMRAAAGEAQLGDAIIVNTCAVTGEAVRQARQAIRRAHRERPGAQIIVTGCAAQIDPQSFADMPEVTRVIGNVEKLRADTFASDARVAVSDIMRASWSAGVSPARGASRPDAGAPTQHRARAYVQVQNGCDHRCTFCIIPYGRGNARSAPAGDVIARIRALVEQGAPEIVLTGVDLTSWGGDLPGAPKLGNLVARILKLVPDLPRLRLSSLDAIELDDQLFDLIANEERIAPHLHLSLQHGADLILKRMKRRHLRAGTIALAQRLKRARPEIALGADLIAGFPTETEEHFAETLALVDECALSYTHVFPFSPRNGTPAARMPQLPRALIKERAARLRAKGAEALRRHLDAWVGKSAEALVERDGFARLPDFTGVTLGRVGLAAAAVGGVQDETQTAPPGIDAQPSSKRPPPRTDVVSPALPTRGRVHFHFTAHDGANLIGIAA